MLTCLAILGDSKSSDEYKPDIARVGKLKKTKIAQKTATGTFSNVITQIQNLPTMELGRRFRTPCKTGNKCGKVIKRLMVPKLAQLENTIMGIMKELSKMPPAVITDDTTQLFVCVLPGTPILLQSLLFTVTRAPRYFGILQDHRGQPLSVEISEEYMDQDYIATNRRRHKIDWNKNPLDVDDFEDDDTDEAFDEKDKDVKLPNNLQAGPV
ncbi:unnamed protein product [Parnassius apollo]|uniref:(apollo) hypothetical protein n=1 Tax=Parnassius apollo TaxID=110799 RepID=A0A8S3Y9N7_PARAO|nr:unnamed protein product [Parnassius apollo]